MIISQLDSVIHNYFIEQYGSLPVKPMEPQNCKMRGFKLADPQTLFLVGSRHEKTENARVLSKHFQARESDFMIEVGSINLKNLYVIENFNSDYTTYVRIRYLFDNTCPVTKCTSGYTEKLFQPKTVNNKVYLNAYAIKENFQLYVWNNRRCIKVEHSPEKASLAIEIEKFSLDDKTSVDLGILNTVS
ncbi:unnamed protein product [Didymodactylos carnosus]|uniref:Uncharacterized protein n=1 Tax=Didymodactylos carnosus TaxID=1234261 RepID=A0A8S2FA34_9BILA|nr:unnamed protein product [Didymodactylos carnosus]CAF4205449.1 unnamed protein product [Didymodactylos carnosus]